MDRTGNGVQIGKIHSESTMYAVKICGRRMDEGNISMHQQFALQMLRSSQTLLKFEITRNTFSRSLDEPKFTH